MIRVILPYHLRMLAQTGVEVKLEVERPLTLISVFDALEKSYPMLRGTIRDLQTQHRRAYLRIFAGKQDLSHESLDTELPEAVATGQEPLRIVGAIAGG
jgi:molybdopterin synthase sulfur carrier subunit